MTFIISIFQHDCKCEPKEVKWNNIKQYMCKSDSIFLIYKVIHYLNDKIHSVNVRENCAHLAEKNSKSKSNWQKINIFSNNFDLQDQNFDL